MPRKKKQVEKAEEEVKETPKEEVSETDKFSYQEVKALAKERGVKSSGTKVQILSRLAKSINKPKPSKKLCEFCNREGCFSAKFINHEPFDNGGKAEAMWENLRKQPRVSFYIPFDHGENQASPAAQVATCQLNGLKINMRKGEYFEVPKQVFEIMVASRKLRNEAIHGASMIDRDSGRKKLVNLEHVDAEDADRGGAFVGTV